jgi:hypothetical protein
MHGISHQINMHIVSKKLFPMKCNQFSILEYFGQYFQRQHWVRLTLPRMKIIFFSATIFWSTSVLRGQTISGTYSAADIPTNLGAYSPSCNGPLTKLSITLPSGGPWIITGIDIAYSMTAQGGGFKSHIQDRGQ